MANSPFFGIDIGLRALQSYQTVLDTIAHNVANANTPGYSRQRVNISSTDPFTNPSFFRPMATGQIGTGVEVDSITRFRDASLERQIRTNVEMLNEFEAREEILQRLEAAFNEPGGTGISGLMNDFFNSFLELNASPESDVVRAQVKQLGDSLSDMFNRIAQELIDLREDVDSDVRETIAGVNTILDQLGSVNELLTGIAPTGDNPNDLLDERDRKLGELAELVDIDISEESDGTVNVYIGGRVVVQDDIVRHLVAVDDSTNSNLAAIKVETDLTGPDVEPLSGELKGLLDMRDDESVGVPFFQEQLDDLAYYISEYVNTQHQQGYGLLNEGNGHDFFVTPSTTNAALAMELSAWISDPVRGLDRIAASANSTGVPGAGLPGDGANALAIAQLADTDVSELNNSTFSERYNTFVSELGVFSREESNKVDNSEFLINQLETIRDDISGVSLDEEAAKMAVFQNSLNAAAQVIRTMDEVYSTLIEMMG